MNRRDALGAMCVFGGAAALATRAAADELDEVFAPSMGVLVDTTKCLGCRMCEYACAEANDLPAPDADIDLAHERQTSPTRRTVVNRFQTEVGQVTVKRQCMHCLQPACAAACLTNAMQRQPQGPITWDEGRCMGCRFCMISCPFDVPKFEYDSPVPRIEKCEMCWDRLEAGQQPACVERCPSGALEFGPRSELLERGKERIYQNPDRYVRHIYGEHEAGGTAWMYLASVPFNQLGFPDVGTTAYPVYTKEFLYAVPLVLTVLPPFLLAVSRAKRAGAVRGAVEQGESEP